MNRGPTRSSQAKDSRRGTRDASTRAAWLSAGGTVLAAVITATFTLFSTAVCNKASGRSFHISYSIIAIIVSSFAACLMIALALFLLRRSSVRKRERVFTKMEQPDLQALRRLVNQELDILSVLSKVIEE